MSQYFQSWIVSGFLLTAVVVPAEAASVSVSGSTNVVTVGATYTAADFGSTSGGWIPEVNYGAFDLTLNITPFDTSLGTLNSVTSEIVLITELTGSSELFTSNPFVTTMSNSLGATSSVSGPFFPYTIGGSINSIYCYAPCSRTHSDFAYLSFYGEPPPGALPDTLQVNIVHNYFSVGVNSADTELVSATLSGSTWLNYTQTYDYTPTVVPIPPAILMLLSGAGLLGWFARRTRR